MPGRNTTNRSSLQDRGTTTTSGSSLGQSYADVRSIGSTATRHWVNSVSDIYGPDEIEELLEDLNRLELAGGGRLQDQEDFDINGSQLGGTRRGKGGKSRSSPTFSVRSWDSHAVYQDCPVDEEDQEPPVVVVLPKTGDAVDDARVANVRGNVVRQQQQSHHHHPQRKMVLCYCETSSLRTPGGILRVLLLITSLACLCTILAAGTATVGLFALPHFPKLRIMMFICIFTILFTAFVLFLNISHMDVLLPFDVGRMQTAVYLLLTVSFLTLSVLVLQVHRGGDFIGDEDDDPDLREHFHFPLSFWTKNHLLIAAILGFCCTAESFLCSFNCGRTQPATAASTASAASDKMVLQESSTHVTLHDINIGGGGNSSSKQVVENVPLQQVVTTDRHANENFFVNKSATTAKHNHHPHPTKPSAPPPSPPPPNLPKPKQDSAGKKPQTNSKGGATSKNAVPVPPAAAPSKQKQTTSNNNNNNPAVATSAAAKTTSSSKQPHSKPQPAQQPPSKKTANSSNSNKKPPPPPTSSSSSSDSDSDSSSSSSSRSSTSLAMTKAPSSHPNPNGKETKGGPSKLKTKALVSSEPTVPPSVPVTTTQHGYSSSTSQGQGFSSSSSEPQRSTGAIPKSKKTRPPPLSLPKEGDNHDRVRKEGSSKVNNPAAVKPSTNHLDEIIALPLDDAAVSPTSNKNGGQRRKHYVH